MATDETYEGWTNRETWAVALHINNDQGWQESVHEALRESRGYGALTAYTAARIIRENVESVLNPFEDDYRAESGTLNQAQWGAIQDIGSMWRVVWDELGAAFLADLEEL